MKRVLILEDKIKIREALGKLVTEVQKDAKVFLAGASEEAYRIAMEHNIDLFLIDIVLDTKVQGDVSGLLFASRIRELEPYRFTPMIMVTSLEDPELHAYKTLHCYGYIKKPYEEKKVAALIAGALQYNSYKDENRTVYFKKDGIFYSKKMKDIVYVKTASGKMIIKTVRDELEIYYKTHAQILKELDSEDFVKCNRNTIVNRQYIDHIDSTNRYITLKEGLGTLEIGTVMKKSFLEEILNG